MTFSVIDDGRISYFELAEAKRNVFEKGDTGSYNDILFYYGDRNDDESTLPYSIIMAFNYNNSDAYYVLYRTIIKMNNNGKFDYSLIKNLNNEDKKFAWNYLIKSSSLGNINAKSQLIDYYENGIYVTQSPEMVKVLKHEIEILKN